MKLDRCRPEGQGDIPAVAGIPPGAGGEEHPVHREGIDLTLPVHPVPGAVPRADQRRPPTMPADQVQPFLDRRVIEPGGPPMQRYRRQRRPRHEEPGGPSRGGTRSEAGRTRPRLRPPPNVPEPTPCASGSRRCRSSWPPIRRAWTPPRRSDRRRPWSTTSARPMPTRSAYSRQSATDWRRKSTGSLLAPIRPRGAPTACALGSMSSSVNGTPHALRPRRQPMGCAKPRRSGGRGGLLARLSGRRGGGR